MTDKVFIVTDLGPGDGGKGTVVHKIATMTHAPMMRLPHTIIKVGGAQGNHGVWTSKRERFAFSQWGCGTLIGIKTHISPRMVVAPIGLLNEADELRHKQGLYDPFSMLTIDQEALCATPYHKISSRLKEMARGENQRGTVGTGVGEAYRYMQSFPELSIRTCDLSRSDLRDMLAAVREQVQRDLIPIIQGEFLPDDRAAVDKEISSLFSDHFLDGIVEQFQEVSGQAKIVDPDYLRREILSQDGVAVVESSHGVLTDNLHGFHPHTSALRTLPCFTQAMLKEADYNGNIVNIGVHRAFEIRHGAGPMPTADPVIGEILQPGSTNEKDRFRGSMQIGQLDLVLLHYAIKVCSPVVFNGLALTWFDPIVTVGKWHICDRYQQGTYDQNYFSPEGEIKVWNGGPEGQLEYQEGLGKALLRCKPEVTTYDLPRGASRDELFDFCTNLLKEKLSVPVKMVSFGPTERDKVCK